MSSILRIASSRANGAKSRGPVTADGKRASAANSANSTGPVTPEGKFHSSQNATRHGLLSDSMVLEGEADDRFCAYLACLEEELQPEPGIESSLVEVMAVSHWRRMRLWSVEKAQYIIETDKRQLAHTHPGETPITQLARSFRSLSDESRALELLNRYETRLSREFERALAGVKNHQEGKPERDRKYLEKLQAAANARAKRVQISKRSEPNLGKLR